MLLNSFEQKNNKSFSTNVLFILKIRCNTNRNEVTFFTQNTIFFEIKI